MKIVLVLTLLWAIKTIKIDELQALGGSTEAETYRAMIFNENRELIEIHNMNPDSTWKMEGYRQFIGLTASEVRDMFFMIPVEDFSRLEVTSAKRVETKITLKSQQSYYFIDLASSYPTPVQSQGQCGNSYAFSALDAVNMVNQKLSKGYPVLSAQHLTDCSKGFYSNDGCRQGWIYESMEYLRANGVYSLTYYPVNLNSFHEGTQQPCKYVSGATRYSIKQWHYFAEPGCPVRIQHLLQGYAISIGVAGGNPYFWYYKSGILSDCPGHTAIDHAAVLVGAYYEPSNLNASYLKIKNSWGSDWGENGYIRISMGGRACSACEYGAFSTQ